LVAQRPFRAPHHTISDAGLIGGGAIPRPGEVSLAHNGLLFLDELPEFPRNVLEVMRQPLEDHTVTIARASMSLTFPARFMLAAAMNPCPCGYFNDKSRECQCTPPMIQRYVAKVSGPAGPDRHSYRGAGGAVQGTAGRSGGGRLDADSRSRDAGAGAPAGALSEGQERIFANAQMGTRQIRAYCELGSDAERLLERAMQQQGLSARAHDRILKVARTIADLEGATGLARWTSGGGDSVSDARPQLLGLILVERPRRFGSF
jgi:magnesium chelatase family protein